MRLLILLERSSWQWRTVVTGPTSTIATLAAEPGATFCHVTVHFAVNVATLFWHTHTHTHTDQNCPPPVAKRMRFSNIQSR